MILGAIGQQHHPLRVERLGRAGVVGHQDHRALIAAQRVEHLLPRRRIQVVGGFVEQQHIGRRGHQSGQRQTGLLAAGQCAGGLVELRSGEHEGTQQAA